LWREFRDAKQNEVKSIENPGLKATLRAPTSLCSATTIDAGRDCQHFDLSSPVSFVNATLSASIGRIDLTSIIMYVNQINDRKHGR
jgi:hypothetical protein